jgi:hypothetical protein
MESPETARQRLMTPTVFSLRMILSENRFPSPIGVEDMLFGIMRAER